jgi:hypothetical protein
MNNFEKLYQECVDYQDFYDEDDLEQQIFYSLNSDVDIDDTLVYGFTPFETFKEILLDIKKPKRFIVFGCSTGYQCFYWNKLFPDVPVIGIDLLGIRLEWGTKKVEEYDINNVTLLQGNFFDFQIEDGDLIWQNNLLFDIEQVNDYNVFHFSNFDIQIVSYVDILFDSNFLIDVNSNPIKINSKHRKLETSWSEDQDLFYFYIEKDNDFEFDVDFILPEYRISETYLKEYEDMLIWKKDIHSERLKLLYNKNNLKNLFIDLGFEVPETYLYTNSQMDFTEKLKNLNSFVAKPAHRSESVDVYIKRPEYKCDFVEISKNLNRAIEESDFYFFRKNFVKGGVWWKDCEKGIIIEECIDVVYELKVFVVFGLPIIADLRHSSLEQSRVDFIVKNNKYLNWDKEYELIKKLAIELKIDYFRIDFLYDGEKLWASEFAPMPATILPEEIENIIYKNWSRPYFKHYYSNLVI